MVYSDVLNRFCFSSQDSIKEISLIASSGGSSLSLSRRIHACVMMLWRKIFPPHPLQDKKYQIALEVQKKGLQNISKTDPRILLERSLWGQKEEKIPYYRSVIRAIDMLEGDQGDVRYRYEMYHHYLREAIQSPYYKEDRSFAKTLLLHLCRLKFEGNDEMLSYHRDIVKEATGSPQKEITDLSSFAEALEDTNRRLKSPASVAKSFFAQAKQKLEGGEQISGADNIGKSNIPEVRSFHFYQNLRITSLRHGTVVISPDGTRCIAPEYLCYLDGKRQNRLNTLYINHQRVDFSSQIGSRWSQFKDGAEVDRSLMIHGIEHNEFHVCSLPMDGPLFDSISDTTDATFKTTLIESFEKEKNGVKLPSRFSTPESRNTLKIREIFDFVHLQYFDKKESFTPEEQKEFLMIFYFYLKERIKKELNIRAVVTVCKDNKDRGNASATIDELMLAYHTNDYTKPAFLTALHNRFFGAFMIKNEHIFDKRVSLVTAVARRLMTRKPQRDQICGEYTSLTGQVLPSKVEIAGSNCIDTLSKKA
jgi:hypothetical protein